MNLLVVDTSVDPDNRIQRLADVVGALPSLEVHPILFCFRPDLFLQALGPSAQNVTIEAAGLGEVPAELTQLYKRSLRAPAQGRRSARYAKVVWPVMEKILDQWRPRGVLFHGMDLSLAPLALGCAQASTPYVVHVSQVRRFSNREGAMLEPAQRVLTCSQAVKRYLNERFPEVFYRKYDIVPWPVERTVEASIPPEAVRKKHATPADAKVILVGGPIASHWGHEHLIDAMVSVKKQFADFMIWFSGQDQGDCAQDLSRRIQKAGLDRAVRFLPAENQANLLRAADLFVYAPQNNHPDQGPVDALAQAVPGAMAAGLPVVVTDAGGAPDPVFGTAAGAVVEPGSAQDLAGALLSFLTRPDLVASAHAAGIKRIGLSRTPQAVARRWAQLAGQIFTEV